MGFMDANLPSLKGENAYYAFQQAFKHNLGPECDVYSLGIMLFRALLVNKRQGIETVCYAVETMSKRIGEIYQSHSNLSGSAALLSDINGYLGSTLRNKLFDQNNINYIPNFNNDPFISADTWHKLLVFGFRLITHVPEFSFCYGSDKHSLPQWTVSEEIIKGLSGIEQEIKHCLFYASPIIEKDFKQLLYEAVADPVWLAGLGDIEVDGDLLIASVNSAVASKSSMVDEVTPSSDVLENTVILSNNNGTRQNNTVAVDGNDKSAVVSQQNIPR